MRFARWRDSDGCCENDLPEDRLHAPGFTAGGEPQDDPHELTIVTGTTPTVLIRIADIHPQLPCLRRVVRWARAIDDSEGADYCTRWANILEANLCRSVIEEVRLFR
jgi:hypothetical protein